VAIALISGAYWSCPPLVGQPASPNHSPLYQHKEQHDPNGIGKFYFDREIARVMGHQAADWLERRDRMREERPDLLIEALALKAGDAVADIGAGSGYYSWRIAEKLGTNGVVYAVDIQQEMLDILAKSMADRRITNVRGTLGTETDPKLPRASIDLALLVDVYHEFEYPYEMMREICAALKPGGRVVLVEFRAEDPNVPIKEVHKMSEKQVRKEMAPLPLVWVETNRVLPWQHIIVFKKK
jgi:ubiquinone/menaquinone biosynthesis C-methylase UbiE